MMEGERVRERERERGGVGVGRHHIIHETGRQASKHQAWGHEMHQCQKQQNLSLIFRRNDKTASELYLPR
jgi:hypothetical protein